LKLFEENPFPLELSSTYMYRCISFKQQATRKITTTSPLLSVVCGMICYMAIGSN